MSESKDGWLEIDERAKSGERILLLWKPCGGLPEHVELGWFSQSAVGWVNTYGKLFSSAPDRYAPLAPLNSYATLQSEIEELKAENERLRVALRFYADPANYIDAQWDDGSDGGCDTPNAIPAVSQEGAWVCDCGDVARAALGGDGNG